MYFADYHMHSLCSFDGNHPVTQLAAQALEVGLSEICVTDHCDLLDQEGAPCNFYNWNPVREQVARARAEFDGRLVIKMGLELGAGYASPRHTEQILGQEDLDFVIGSVHNMSPKTGGRDFYFEDFSTPEKSCALLENYLECLLDVAKSPYYDVLGHVVYLLRYVPQEEGFPRDLSPWWEQVIAILKTTVEQGKGIEVNTYCGRTLEAYRPVLMEFKRQGGEILTFGSDAHHAENVGKAIEQAQELARACGFKAFATFTKRKPSFHDLKG